MTVKGFDVEGFQCVSGSESALVIDNSVRAIHEVGEPPTAVSSFELSDRKEDRKHSSFYFF